MSFRHDFREQQGGFEHAQLSSLGSTAAASSTAILALIDKGAAGAELAARGTCNKYLVLPVHAGDIIAAVATLASTLAPAEAPPPATVSLAGLLKERAERNDLRGLLALLNATGPFRFTSILRFEDDGRLSSVWTFDRENRLSDGFPVDA